MYTVGTSKWSEDIVNVPLNSAIVAEPFIHLLISAAFQPGKLHVFQISRKKFNETLESLTAVLVTMI